MKKISLVFVTLLSSCNKATKKTLGLTQDMPDEFQVKTAKPLEVPPHFDLQDAAQEQKIKPAGKKLPKREKGLLTETEN